MPRQLRPILVFIVILIFIAPTPVRAQQTPQNTFSALGGVAISPDGLLSIPTTITTTKNFQQKPNPNLTYLSLKRILSLLQSSTQNKTPIPNDLRYLQGLTRIDYLYLFPSDSDIILAGPAEPLDPADIAKNPLQPTGTLSHRPALHFDDLITALRSVHNARLAAPQRDAGPPPNTIFGCSIDMPPNAQQIATDIYNRFSNAPNATLAHELKSALGPQTIRILGVPPTSRIALAMTTADYRLKRIAMAAEPPPLPIIGNALGGGGIASNRVWFEPAYHPIAISADTLSYHVSGPRLKVLAGPIMFNSHSANGGATTTATNAATAFAKRFSDNLPAAAAKLDAFADLQNITDLFLLATLLEYPNKTTNLSLAEKAHLDLTWLLDPNSPDAYRPATYPAPTSAETLLANTPTALASGGILLATSTLLNLPTTPAPETSPLLAARGQPTTSWFLTKVHKQSQ